MIVTYCKDEHLYALLFRMQLNSPKSKGQLITEFHYPPPVLVQTLQTGNSLKIIFILVFAEKKGYNPNRSDNSKHRDFEKMLTGSMQMP